MPLKDWSTTDADNDDADLAGNINWKEQQAPSTVNNSARAMMTQIKRFFDEIAGGTVFVPAAGVAGTANAITLSTDQTAPYAAGQRYMFIAEAANTGAVTVNKDGEGARALKNHGLALLGGEIKSGDMVVIAADGTDYELVYPWRVLPQTAMLLSTDASSSPGPVLEFYRRENRADNDLVGTLLMSFDDASGAKFTHWPFLVRVTDAANGSVDTQLWLRSAVGSSNGERLIIGQGAYTPGATGGDQGANTINASGVYDDGLLLRGTPIALLEDQKSSGVDGGTFNSGADQVRTLNAEVFDPYSLVTLSSNQFTLPAGNWLIRWAAPANKVGPHQSFLYDVTGAAEVKRGQNCVCNASDRHTISSAGSARVTPSGSNTYEIRHRCSASRSADGFGEACGFGTEVYTRVEIYAG